MPSRSDRRNRESRRPVSQIILAFEGMRTEPNYFKAIKESKIALNSKLQIFPLTRDETRVDDSHPWAVLRFLEDNQAWIESDEDSCPVDLFLIKYLRCFNQNYGSYLKGLNDKEEVKRGVHWTTTYPFFENTKETLREILKLKCLINEGTVNIKQSLDHLNEFMESFCKTEISIDPSSFDKPSNLGENYYVMVVDRDQQSFKSDSVKKIKHICEKKGYGLIITNPNFELWIAMHFDNYDKNEMLESIREMVQLKYVEKRTREELKDVKLGPLKVVDELYQKELHRPYRKSDEFKWAREKVQQALENSQSLCIDLNVLINELTIENYPNTIGTNIGELFKLIMDSNNQRYQT